MNFEKSLSLISNYNIQDKVEIRTSTHTWWFTPDHYHDKNQASVIIQYNQTVSSPYREIRNYYGGRCFGFLPPTFLWEEGVRRIGIFLKKPSFVRS